MFSKLHKVILTGSGVGKLRRLSIKAALLCQLFTLQVLPCRAEVIFEDNFDHHADWNANGRYEGSQCGKKTCPGNLPPPNNWSFYRAIPALPSFPPTIAIRSLPGSQNDHSSETAKGKAVIVQNESYPAYTNSSWPGDGIMGKLFRDRSYPELYVRFWLKTQANWQNVTSGYAKIFRVSYFDGSGDALEYFSGGTHSPMLLFFLGNDYKSRGAYAFGFRCDPRSQYYYCNQPGSPVYTQTDTLLSFGSGGSTAYFADTNWHRFDIHIKMNEAGANNGISEFWYDGRLIVRHTDVQWKAPGSAAAGWNAFALGGNSNNAFTAEGSQWYAIDDVVVSTTAIPDNYIIKK